MAFAKATTNKKLKRGLYLAPHHLAPQQQTIPTVYSLCVLHLLPEHTLKNPESRPGGNILPESTLCDPCHVLCTGAYSPMTMLSMQ